MSQWFTIIPKGLLATLVIGAGIVFFLLSDPPHTVCESQLEVLKDAQRRFLFLDPKQKKVVTTRYKELSDRCKMTNSPGGCYELFQDVRTMIEDLDAVPSDCASRAGDITEVHKALWEVSELMVRLAWGEKPPATYQQKFGWLDVADISLYCLLKKQMIRDYGDDAWEQFRGKMYQELPGAVNMGPNDIWDMSLFSENCARYP